MVNSQDRNPLGSLTCRIDLQATRNVSCTRSSARWTSPTSRKTREKTRRAVRLTSSSNEARSPIMLFRTSASSDSLKVCSVHQRERYLDEMRAHLFRECGAASRTLHRSALIFGRTGGFANDQLGT